MKTIMLIRHGLTAGNREKRYIGRTDEPLCGEGIAQVQAMRLPRCDAVYTSPMARCRQTADILFPGQPVSVIQDLRECDFGIFEGKTAAELSDDAAYRAWVDSYCLSPIPGGDDVAAFWKRCCDAFAGVVFNPRHRRADIEFSSDTPALAFVTHGGCIMAILEHFARPKRSFYDYHIQNGGFYLCQYENGVLTI